MNLGASVFGILMITQTQGQLIQAPQAIAPEMEPNTAPSLTLEKSTKVNQQSLKVEKIKVLGSTIFGDKEFNPIIKAVEGHVITLEELRKVADAITQLYLDKGYITSRAVITDQTIKDGIVQIQIIEGSIERIEIEGTRRLNPNYIRERVLFGATKPLSTSAIEDQLRLLRLDPLFTNVEASLRSGSQLGKSIVVVRVEEANPLNVTLSFDNYSPPSVGSERLGISASHRNLTGNGDELDASYYFSAQGGTDNYDFSYRIPLNANNSTLQLRAALNYNRVIQEPFKQFNIKGNSELYELSYRQPLIRTPREEFALSLGFTVQNGQTFTFAGPTPFGFGPDKDGNSRTRVIKFGQDYVKRDTQGAWALRSSLNFGIGAFDATENPAPIPDGQFLSWLAQIQRVQRINNDNYFIAQTDLQLTPNALLPSQQFVMGGGQSLRGYRQNARAGDNGLRLSIEDRWTIQRNAKGDPTLQLAPFIDLGWVWNVGNNPNRNSKQNFLAGAGLGILWQPIKHLDVRLDYALPLVNLEDRGKNIQDNGFYFSINYRL